MGEKSASYKLVEKLEHLVHVFVPAVGLIYGCGFLVVFTFFNHFGIDSLDLIEAKYIHVGVLFCFACLVVGVPLWWFAWPLRSRSPDRLAPRIQDALLEPPGKKLIKRLISSPLRRFFFPQWSVDPTHGIHAGPAVRISMILILWSFTSIVMFSPPSFGRVHPKLAILNFLTPMVVLAIGYLADFFKGGELSKEQLAGLVWVRFWLRLWWLPGGIACFCFYLFIDNSKQGVIHMGVIFFGLPLLLIAGTFGRLFWSSSRRNMAENMLTRIDACQWALYSTQWAALIFQIWIFIWTIDGDNLGASLREILFGKNYFHELGEQVAIPALWRHISAFERPPIPFPHGGIYFIFIILLIGMFIIRHAYRLKQIGSINDTSHQVAASISVAALVVPLAYISILTFAYTVYPYIPYEKGGGDFSGSPAVHFTFNADINTKTNLPVDFPLQDLSAKSLSCLIVLDENASFIYVAATNDCGGPLNWRTGGSKPKVYEIRRDTIASMHNG